MKPPDGLGPVYPTGAGFQKGSDTSRAAAADITEKLPERQWSVYCEIYLAGELGMTSDEVALKQDRPLHTVAPRCTELRKLGLIVDSGQRRLTRSGKSAMVFVIAPRRP